VDQASLSDAVDQASLSEAMDQASLSEAAAAGSTAPTVALRRPAAHVVTRWGSDRFSLGSYSVVGVQASPADRKALAEPVLNAAATAAGGGRGRGGGGGGGDVDHIQRPCLVFAGEATRTDFPSTAHGAIMSGQDAAGIVARELRGPRSSGSS
jgi:hypothetical protein